MRGSWTSHMLARRGLHGGDRTKWLRLFSFGHRLIPTAANELCNNLRADCRLNRTAATMEERDLYDERAEKRPATLNCPHCKQAAEYEVGWLVRSKKRQLPGRAD